MAETPVQPHRRWLRFSLRTLFVLVTALACWLGCEFNWIRERHEVTAKFAAVNQRLLGRVIVLGDSDPTAPWPLYWLGEDGHGWVAVEANTSEEEADRIRKLFPESQIIADTDVQGLPGTQAEGP